MLTHFRSMAKQSHASRVKAGKKGARTRKANKSKRRASARKGRRRRR